MEVAFVKEATGKVKLTVGANVYELDPGCSIVSTSDENYLDIILPDGRSIKIDHRDVTAPYTDSRDALVVALGQDFFKQLIEVSSNISFEISDSGLHIKNENISSSAPTRIDATSHTCKKVFATASISNTGYIKVGFSDMGTTGGVILLPGDSVCFDISNSNLLYAVAEVNGEDIYCTVLL